MTRIADEDKRPVPAALAGWLRTHAGLVGDLELRQVAGGRSNVTAVLTDARGHRVVVRRPPDGRHEGGAHDVVREARIQLALAPSPVPVPVVLAICTDQQVADGPFYVMEHAAGEVVAGGQVARGLAPEARRALGFALVDVLADLQAVDLDAARLASLRRATPYLHRQLRRWSAQWEATTDRAVPAVDHVRRRLEVVLPQLAGEPDVLIHGDFRLGNVMVDPQGCITALLDWELATTGHPLADLGFLGARMQAPSEVVDHDEPSAVDGFPGFGELVAHFERRTGVSTADLPVFLALSAWRWAIIVDGVRRRFAAGRMGGVHEDAALHARRAELLADYAADLLP